MAKAEQGLFKDWEALHQQWQSAVSDGVNRFMQGGRGQRWSDQFNGFGDLFAGKLGDTTDAATDRFVGGAKQYLDWVEKFSGQLASGVSFPTSSDDWVKLFQGALGPMGETQNPLRDMFAAMSGDTARGFDQFTSGWGNPADMMKGEMKGFLGMPAFGFNRESQERQQRIGIAFMAYQEAMSAYNRLMLDASKRAVEKFQSLLAERETPGRQVDSLRAVYDLWIDAAEAGYAEVALGDEFQTAYGDLVNKQMTLRSLIQGEVERATGQFGMPTRTEVNSTARRMQEMRREMRVLEERLEALEAGKVAAPTRLATSAASRFVPAKAAKPAPAKPTPAKTRMVSAKPVSAKPKNSTRKAPAKKAARRTR